MTNLLIVAGVLVLSFALRTSHLRVIRKAGALGVLGATFLAFYFFTDSVAIGVVGWSGTGTSAGCNTTSSWRPRITRF